MKGVPWRPVLRFGLIRCDSQTWLNGKAGRCKARATRFFVWDKGFEAACEDHADRFMERVWLPGHPRLLSPFVPGLREMEREEWEICKVQES